MYWLSYPFHTEFDDHSDATRDYDELDGSETMGNGTSTRFYHHVHWTSYTAVIFAGLAVAVLLVCAIVRWSRAGGTVRRRGRKSKDHRSDEDDSDLEAGRLRKIRSWTAQAEANGLYHTSQEDF